MKFEAFQAAATVKSFKRSLRYPEIGELRSIFKTFFLSKFLLRPRVFRKMFGFRDMCFARALGEG